MRRAYACMHHMHTRLFTISALFVLLCPVVQSVPHPFSPLTLSFVFWGTYAVQYPRHLIPAFLAKPLKMLFYYVAARWLIKKFPRACM